MRGSGDRTGPPVGVVKLRRRSKIVSLVNGLRAWSVTGRKVGVGDGKGEHNTPKAAWVIVPAVLRSPRNRACYKSPISVARATACVRLCTPNFP